MAAQKLELKTVPCIRLGHLTDTQRRAYILADNRLAEIGGGWDEEMMALELGDLRELDFDLNLIGLDNDKIESILNPPEPMNEAPPESSTQEIDVDSFNMEHRCPRCGFEFDSKKPE
jgi:ParB-like chromosome segregation protein Spo0J